MHVLALMPATLVRLLALSYACACACIASENQALQTSEACRVTCSAACFTIDFATTSFQIKSKEAMHIKWEKPTLSLSV